MLSSSTRSAYKMKESITFLDLDASQYEREDVPKFTDVGFHPLSHFSVQWDFFMSSCIIIMLAKFYNVAGTWISNHKSASIFTKYTWSLFQAVGNTFPLTYKPDTTAEQWAVIFFVIAGAALYACIVGSISSFAMGLDAAGKLFRQKMDELNDYMTWKKLSPITRQKVRRYYEIKYRGKLFEEATLLASMNESLRSEIAIHNCRELITKVPFLRREENDGRDEMFIGRIATSL
ncbi:anaphase-promoting complex subunit Hcn1, partial [Chytridiales sp. JEL 0842]